MTMPRKLLLTFAGVSLGLALVRTAPIALSPLRAPRREAPSKPSTPVLSSTAAREAPRLPTPRLSKHGVRRLMRTELLASLREQSKSFAVCGVLAGAVMNIDVELTTHAARILDVRVIDARGESEATLTCVQQQLLGLTLTTTSTVATPVRTRMSFRL